MRAHAIYLATIAVLVIALAVAAARGARAARVAAEVEARFGVGGPAGGPPRAGVLRPYRPAELLRPRTLGQYRQEVDALIARACALGDFGAPRAGRPPSRLAAACAAALAGGKRLRAAVALEVARAVSAKSAAAWRAAGGRGAEPAPADAAEVAILVEYLHAASLVVDDAPAFDDAPTRRGQPAVHVAWGSATAQMAALTLMATAMRGLGRQIDWIRENCSGFINVDRMGTRATALVARALTEAAEGQYMDVSAAEDLGREFGADGAALVAARKTGSLFALAAGAGWLAAGGDADDMETARDAGQLLGTAYQIADDIADMSADTLRIAAGRSCVNFACTYGVDVARREVARNLNGARLLLTQASLWTPLWADELFPAVLAIASEHLVEPVVDNVLSSPSATDVESRT